MTSHMTVNRERLRELFQQEAAAFIKHHPKSATAYEAAKTHLLGGVPMPWMVRWPGAFPLFAAEASGATITDLDGFTYTDFALGDTGAMTGHSPAYVVDALTQQAAKGITTMLPSENAAWVANELATRFGVPIWQIAMTATDANRFALRIARYITGRPKILVFDACYHGSVDETLVRLSPDGRVIPRSSNCGPQIDPALTTRVVQFNDLEALERELAKGDVAAVLAEPALTNIGIVLPDLGFHDVLRSVTHAYGSLLLIDETHTICAGPGGATTAWGLKPDMITIGKPIGGGMPCAAYGMSTEIAARLQTLMSGDAIDVSGLGGTLSGNALATAAMRATLSNSMRADDFAITIPLATRWTDGVASVINDHALPWTVQQLGCRAEYWFCEPPRNGGNAANAVDHELEKFLHLWCLNRGYLLTPFHNMALLSTSHTNEQVDGHTDVFAAALDALT